MWLVENTQCRMDVGGRWMGGGGDTPDTTLIDRLAAARAELLQGCHDRLQVYRLRSFHDISESSSISPFTPFTPETSLGTCERVGFQVGDTKTVANALFSSWGREGRKHSRSRENPYTFFFSPPITTSMRFATNLVFPIENHAFSLNLKLVLG